MCRSFRSFGKELSRICLKGGCQTSLTSALGWKVKPNRAPREGSICVHRTLMIRHNYQACLNATSNWEFKFEDCNFVAALCSFSIAKDNKQANI